MPAVRSGKSPFHGGAAQSEAEPRLWVMSMLPLGQVCSADLPPAREEWNEGGKSALRPKHGPSDRAESARMRREGPNLAPASQQEEEATAGRWSRTAAETRR